MLLLFLTACGPQIGDLERGEQGSVVRAYNGDTLQLDSGMRVFLAEIDAPRGEDDYAAQAQGELEALTLHRPVLLAYGGTKRWAPRPRPDEPPPEEPPPETAIAHVFVQSEGGRWFWLQHEMIARGAAFVRPRRDNRARTSELLDIEARARAEEHGLWGRRAYQALAARAAGAAALAYNENCTRAAAPYRLIEGRIASADVFERRAALTLEGANDPPFAIVVFGQNFAQWDGPALNSLTGARIRARGALGVYREQPQMCLDDSAQLEILAD